jgi:hypothetical protein
MKHAVEMGSGVMIYITSFIKINSDSQSRLRGYTGTQKGRRSHKPTLGKYAKKKRDNYGFV